MKIVEPDCYIEYKDKSYHLYLLKNKKEFKEDDTNTHKIGGYFIELDSAFKKIIRFRSDKKYKFKENWKPLYLSLGKYTEKKKDFNELLKSIYIPIKNLQNKLFVYEKHKINYWK